MDCADNGAFAMIKQERESERAAQMAPIMRRETGSTVRGLIRNGASVHLWVAT